MVVTITGKDSGKTVFGKYSKVTIQIVETSSAAYELVYNTDVHAYIDSLIQYDEKYYATAGSEYTIAANEGFEIVSVKINGTVYTVEDTEYTFTMPEAAIEIVIDCQQLKFEKIALYSDVAFTLDGVNYDGYAEIDVTGNPISNPVSQDGNHVFLGWARRDGNGYVLESDTVGYSTYYAVWVYNRGEIDFNSLSVSGSTVTVPLIPGNARSIYGWYYNSEFSGDMAALCSNNAAALTSITSTILYARLVYNFNYTMTGTQSTSWGASYTYYVGDNRGEQKYGTSGSFGILEGTEFKYSWKESKKVLFIEYYDENNTYQTKYFEFKYKSTAIGSSNTQYEVITGSFNNALVTEAVPITVNGNLTITLKDSKNAP